MTDVSDRSRIAKGTPQGGQFAKENRRTQDDSDIETIGGKELPSNKAKTLLDGENVSKDTLTMLANHSDGQIRKLVAANSATPPTILRQLSLDDDGHVRESVAGNLNTPSNTARMLAQDDDVRVRAMVAINFNTPSDTLAMLATDSEKDVRKNVALNQNTPPIALRILARDPNPLVRTLIAMRSDLDCNLLDLLSYDSDWRVLRVLAARDDLTDGQRVRLLRTPDPTIQSLLGRRDAAEWLHGLPFQPDMTEWNAW